MYIVLNFQFVHRPGPVLGPILCRDMWPKFLHILLVFCGAQYFGEGLDVINTTISGDSGQYLLSATSSNTFLAVAIHFIFGSGVMQVSSRHPKSSIENSNTRARENFISTDLDCNCSGKCWFASHHLRTQNNQR